MKSDEAINLLKEVYNDILTINPDVEYHTYRDGGSVAFSVPGEPYKNIILVSPVVWKHIGDHKVETVMAQAYILKEGCVRFEDAYETENIIGTVPFDGWPEPYVKKIKNQIKALLADRICNNNTNHF